MTLAEQDRINLQWMARCNDEYGVGFLGPTVRRLGRIPECEPLVEAGLARCSDRSTWSARKPPFGYFITPAGRAALTQS